ncbi:MAG: peptide chain release factor 1 [Austwickia sp.]|jgi:peptide chain release factor 1|nr:peptide chain release factor 1 [Austwickia sp.]MBK8436856.1 peptide chain release factor 1 [Austwickia sp.]MBK9100484.1 peptide chain release factor 1 [Austwickia sp.]
MLESAAALVAEYDDLERSLADPEVFGDTDRLRTLNRRYAALGPVVHAYRQLHRLSEDLTAARELAVDDETFALEALDLAGQVQEAEEVLRRLLLPRDPDDDRDVIMEIKAGEGGQESALFAADLLRMYLRYAERRGWRTEILDANESDLGGYKDVQVAVKAKGAGTPAPGQAPWARLKYEGGVHRVQRVPVTESQGRIHTSAAGVLVMPEIDDPEEVQIAAADLKIDVFRSSGPGGQSVNTTDSAVRITHLPTGLVVSCQNEKSQLQNKEQAMRVLRARLHQVAVDEAEQAASDARRSQVRTVDRSERIRTYNYPENRIADHRTGFKAHHLDAVLDGDLDAVIESAMSADEAAKMAAVGSGAGGGAAASDRGGERQGR